MLDDLAFCRNSFQEILSTFEHSVADAAAVDIFSRACVDAFASHDWARFGYPFTQIFEPDVLREVAVLEGVPYESLIDLAHRPTPTARRLAGMADDDELTLVERVNLASAFVSVSRFDAAIRVLDAAAGAPATPRERFEVAWLEFTIANRRDDGAGSPRAFAEMRAAVTAGGVPRGRVLDACTQAVVWFVKRREVPEEAFRWWLGLGRAVARDDERLDAGSVSSWYRGLAMVPAATGDAVRTRRYMELACEAAEEQVGRHPGAFELNSIKTYHESSLKEHVYVTRDLERAEEAGRSLIELDPAWAPSYGELADAYARFGRHDRAAELYEQAVDAGPPYLGHHLLRAATCRSGLGHDDQALGHYLALARLAPKNQRLLRDGLAIAQRAGHPALRQFEDALAASGPPVA